MQTVNIDKIKLIEVVVQNRALHIKEYDESVINYRQIVIDTLSTILESAIGDGPIDLKPINNLTIPASYESNYDRALRMLDMSTDQIIKLDEEEFRNLVEDEWNWSRGFKATTSFYNAK